MAEPEVGEHPPGLLDLPDEIYRQIARSLDDRSFCRLFASWRQSREVLLPDHTARKGLRAVLKNYGIDPNATVVHLAAQLKRTPLDVVVPALATMPNLTWLRLAGNQIEDVAPLDVFRRHGKPLSVGAVGETVVQVAVPVAHQARHAVEDGL